MNQLPICIHLDAIVGVAKGLIDRPVHGCKASEGSQRGVARDGTPYCRIDGVLFGAGECTGYAGGHDEMVLGGDDST